MGKHVKVNVSGYGIVKIKNPKQYSRETFSQGIVQAVIQTMELALKSQSTFHPVLGNRTAPETPTVAVEENSEK